MTMTRRHLFVVPEMTASITGGNLYNLGLTSALRAAGVEVRVVDLDGAEAALRDAAAGIGFVDSLYLDHLPRLKQGLPVYLLAHYLPSLVARGNIPLATELSQSERAALAAADGFLVPSEFMARALTALAPGRHVLVVPPALPDLPPRADAPVARDALQAVLVANLVAGKGVLPFLDALMPWLRDGARIALTIIGSAASDPAYAAACRTRVAGEPVDFLGALSHPATLAQVVASDLFVSASRMESFGLALAEARALGVPIAARDGGNAAAHVEESAGGRLLDSDEALAAECARLARDPVELARRRRAAQAAPPPRRTWADAARDFVSAGDGAPPPPPVNARERASE